MNPQGHGQCYAGSLVSEESRELDQARSRGWMWPSQSLPFASSAFLSVSIQRPQGRLGGLSCPITWMLMEQSPERRGALIRTMASKRLVGPDFAR